ncbi:Fc.00g062470.m01.CDS01 [Cosmosporella sp. VM-42]
MNSSILTGRAVRIAARQNSHTTSTSGLAPGYLQANLVILPSRYATDFRNLCARNPVPCPLLAESAAVGSYDAVKSWIKGIHGNELLADGCDIRKDAPRFMVYKDSKLDKDHCSDITAEWTEDHIAFLVGCSFSFEHELSVSGLPPRHAILDRTVPMYRTKVPLCPSGVFAGSTMVVSMRPYKKQDVDMVRKITRKHGYSHGEPVAWGWEALQTLGIIDIDAPEWGDPPLTADRRSFGQLRRDNSGEIPLFWGCGITPQEAVMKAGLEGTVMAHAPGHMLVLDATDKDIEEW